MRAQPGDWLLVEGRTDQLRSRRGEIREVHGSDGQPPYLVKWLEDGHEGLVFPGPDAQVLSAAELAGRDARERQRIENVQRLIGAQPEAAGDGSESASR
jgi:hypothetical protein